MNLFWSFHLQICVISVYKRVSLSIGWNRRQRRFELIMLMLVERDDVIDEQLNEISLTVAFVIHLSRRVLTLIPQVHSLNKWLCVWIGNDCWQSITLVLMLDFASSPHLFESIKMPPSFHSCCQPDRINCKQLWMTDPRQSIGREQLI